MLTKFIDLLNYQVPTPSLYGWFHISFIILIIAVTVLLCVKFKNASCKTYKNIVFIAWIIIFVLELLKQFNYSFTNQNGKVVFDYQWYVFPFQFCSSPLYVFPIIAFCKNKKLYEALISFTMTFMLFAGIAVTVYPGDVYTPILIINIQTSIHHGAQVVIGFLTICVYREKLKNYAFYLKGVLVFLALVLIAVILNLLAPTFTTETFNMFFISPYFDCIFPVLVTIQKTCHYIVFLLAYTLSFSVAALIIFEVSKLIVKTIKKA